MATPQSRDYMKHTNSIILKFLGLVEMEARNIGQYALGRLSALIALTVIMVTLLNRFADIVIAIITR